MSTRVTVSHDDTAGSARPGGPMPSPLPRNHRLRRAKKGSTTPALVSIKQHGLASAVALASLMILTWGVSRPALWLDESASVVATQRTWSNLPIMLAGSDAPLVPYYAFLKAVTSAVVALAPGAALSPEALFRGPSVAVTVLAAWALTLWLARRCPAPLVVSTAVLLVAAVPFSRYGQEARPYALVLAAAVVCTILWTRLVRDPRRRWIALYALSVAALVSAHLLAATLVMAHLVAAPLCASVGKRRSVTVRTAVAAALGLILVSPYAVLASLNGAGPRQTSASAFERLISALDRFRVGPPLVTAGLIIGAVVALALLVVLILRLPIRYQFVVRLAAAWALVPPALLIPVVLLQPHLFRSRYLIFVLPAWAILGGLSVVALMDLVDRLLTRIASRKDGSPAHGRFLTYLAGGVAAILPAAVCVTQIDGLKEVRTQGGHGEDIRPALTAAGRPDFAHLPILVLPPSGALEVAAYSPADEDRLLDVDVQRDQAQIWPAVAPRRERQRLLRQHPRVLLFLRTPSTACGLDLKGKIPVQVDRCLPADMRAMGYHVVSAEARGHRWAFAVVAR
jgi:hypothetical protein